MQDVPAAAHEVSYEIDGFDPEPFTIWIHSNDATLTPSPEAYVAATLLPAMKKQVPLQPHASLDPVFAKNLRTIQDIYATWYDEADYVDVASEGTEPTRSTSEGLTATFFTGGVDSFYTLLKNQEEIDALVYVHGFDAKLDDMPLRRQVSEMLHAVGRHFGKEVIELETNLHDFSNGRAGWGQYHGAALAFVALSLKELLREIYIPSSLPYDDLRPWGSSPLLDPLWSTGSLQLVHDGCEANRLQKVRRVSSDSFAMEWLRVCWKNPDSVYNCGRCEKCVRTMIQLLAADALQRVETFEATLNTSDLHKNSDIILRKKYHYEDPVSVLEKKNRVPEITSTLRKILRGPSMIERAGHSTHDAYLAFRHRIGNQLRRLGLHG